MLFKFVIFLDKPNISPPTSEPTISPGFVSLTCGQDVTIPSFHGLAFSFTCVVFNGSGFTTQVYRDDVLIANNFALTFTNPGDNAYGTYTFVVSVVDCGSARAVSRVLRQGQCL